MKWQKHLTHYPIDWLLEKETPSVRYYTLRYVCDGSEQEINDTVQRIPLSETYRTIMHCYKNGYFGPPSALDELHAGTLWYLALLAFLKAPADDDRILQALENCIFASVDRDGGFGMAVGQPNAIGCKTGAMTKILIHFRGPDDSNTIRALDWILRFQRKDGGWLHSPFHTLKDTLNALIFKNTRMSNKYDFDDSIMSSFAATLECLHALSMIPEHRRTPSMKHAIMNGADFLLRHRLFRSCSPPYTPLRNTSCIHHDVRLMSIPVALQYSITGAVYVLTQLGYADDPRLQEAAEIIYEKQSPDGTWNLEIITPGMMYGYNNRQRYNKKDKWVTLFALISLKNIISMTGHKPVGYAYTAHEPEEHVYTTHGTSYTK